LSLRTDQQIGEIQLASLAEIQCPLKSLAIFERENFLRKKLLHGSDDLRSRRSIIGFQHPLDLTKDRIGDKAGLPTLRGAFDQMLRQSGLPRVISHYQSNQDVR